MAKPTEQTYQTIHVKRQGPVFTIQLNKPPLNIIDAAMIEEILMALQETEADPETRIIVFRSAGEKAFSAGVSLQDHTPDLIRDMIPRFDEIFRQLARTDKVTLAVVQGYCYGGGFELVLICDLVVAAENTQLGQPEIKVGQLPPVGIVLLPHLIGYRKAAELLLTGRNISAQEGEALGLVNRVVPREQLSQAANDLIREMLNLSGSALRLNKNLLRRVSGLDFDHTLQKSEEFFLEAVVPTHDAQEGVFAFLEKRAPQWTHR